MKDAEPHCQLCLEYDEKNPECLNAMGIIAFARGQDGLAKSYYSRAIRNYEDFAQARNNLGAVYYAAGDYERALKLFLSAVEIDPRYLDGRTNIARTHLKMAQRVAARKGSADAHLDHAEAEYRRILAIVPNHIGAHHDLGVVFSLRADAAETNEEHQRHFDDAEASFKGCLRLNPRHETCHGNLGHLYLGHGRTAEAEFHLRACLNSNPGSVICTEDLRRAIAVGPRPTQQ